MAACAAQTGEDTWQSPVLAAFSATAPRKEAEKLSIFAGMNTSEDAEYTFLENG